MESIPDYVHLVIKCDPQFGIHRVVKHLKGSASRVFPMDFGYCVSKRKE
ncbi:transposase [Paenibacillus thiaminolyticus]